MSRTATRALVLLALLVAAGAVVAVVLGQGGGGGSSSSGATAPAASAGRKGRAPKPVVAAGTKVANATPQSDWRPYSGPVPILRYHLVDNAEGPGDYSELSVSPTDFRGQMGWLVEHGYEAVTLEAVERAWSAGGTLPPKPIVLSFDGVAGDLMEVVEPELSTRGWPGVLVADPGMPAGEATATSELVALGWELWAEGPEPAAARRSLEARFATPVRDFAFPQGKSGGGEAAALKAAGFRGATAPGYGFAESRHPFDQPRITIFGLSRIDGFAEAIRSRGAGVGA